MFFFCFTFNILKKIPQFYMYVLYAYFLHFKDLANNEKYRILIVTYKAIADLQCTFNNNKNNIYIDFSYN